MGNFINKQLRPSLHFPSQGGFTLIELIVVFSIVSVLTALGIQSFSSFNNSETVATATTDVANMFQTAKSRAISQAIPTSCKNNTFAGYQVTITTKTYTLSAVCNGIKPIQISTNTMPSNVTILGGIKTPILFTAGTGTVSSPVTIAIGGYGHLRNIAVSTAGTTTITIIK